MARSSAVMIGDRAMVKSDGRKAGLKAKRLAMRRKNIKTSELVSFRGEHYPIVGGMVQVIEKFENGGEQVMFPCLEAKHARAVVKKFNKMVGERVAVARPLPLPCLASDSLCKL